MPDSVQKTTITKPRTRNATQISRHVTPDDFRTAFRMAQSGDPEKLFAILKFFYKMDDQIPAAMQSLISAIIGDEMVITPRDQFGEKAKKQAEVLQSIFDEMDFVDMLEHLLKAHYYGFAAVAIPGEAWQTITIDGSTYQAPTTYEVLPQSWIFAKKENRQDETNTIFVGDQPYYQYPAGSVIMHTFQKLPSFENIDFTDFGVGLGCIRYAVFKYFNEEDAAAFNETFATPLILGKVGQGGKEETLKKAVQGIRNDARAVINEADDITFVTPDGSQSGADIYDTSSNRWDKAIAKKIKSENLTDNMGNNGSYAAMYTTNGVRLDVANMLGRKLLRTIMRRLIQPIADQNWKGEIMVDISLPIQGVDDLVQHSNVDTKLLQHLDGSERHLRDKYNFPAPEDEEDTVRRRRGIGGIGL